MTITIEPKEISALTTLFSRRISADEIVTVVKENVSELTDEISRQLAEDLTAIHRQHDISLTSCNKGTQCANLA